MKQFPCGWAEVIEIISFILWFNGGGMIRVFSYFKLYNVGNYYWITNHFWLSVLELNKGRTCRHSKQTKYKANPKNIRYGKYWIWHLFVSLWLSHTKCIKKQNSNSFVVFWKTIFQVLLRLVWNVHVVSWKCFARIHLKFFLKQICNVSLQPTESKPSCKTWKT